MTLDYILKDGRALGAVLMHLSEKDQAIIEGVILGLDMARSTANATAANNIQSNVPCNA